MKSVLNLFSKCANKQIWQSNLATSENIPLSHLGWVSFGVLTWSSGKLELRLGRAAGSWWCTSPSCRLRCMSPGETAWKSTSSYWGKRGICNRSFKASACRSVTEGWRVEELCFLGWMMRKMKNGCQIPPPTPCSFVFVWDAYQSFWQKGRLSELWHIRSISSLFIQQEKFPTRDNLQVNVALNVRLPGWARCHFRCLMTDSSGLDRLLLEN